MQVQGIVFIRALWAQTIGVCQGNSTNGTSSCSQHLLFLGQGMLFAGLGHIRCRDGGYVLHVWRTLIAGSAVTALCCSCFGSRFLLVRQAPCSDNSNEAQRHLARHAASSLSRGGANWHTLGIAFCSVITGSFRAAQGRLRLADIPAAFS